MTDQIAKVMAVGVDFGDILANFQKEDLACLRLARFGAVNTPQETEALAKRMYKDLFNNEAEWARQRGEISGQELFYYCQKKYYLKLRLVSYDVFSVLWGEIFSKTSGLPNIVRDIRASGVRVYVFSNAEELHWPYVLKITKDLGFDERNVFASYQIGSRKPEKKYWETVQKIIDLPFEQILYIGDEPKFVQSWRDMGGQGLRYDPKERFVSNVELRKNIAAYGVKI
jgi:FMN phosphatase YigB (HAD superfamily)